jgi:putative ABC transport system permease protein
MPSAVLRKSVTDLTHRKARTLFTVLTLALAVASVGIFAVPALMQRSMDREIAANRLPDVTLSMQPLELNAGQLAALDRIPNVEAVEPRSMFVTRIWVAGRRERAIVVGVPDFTRQRADVVFIDSGSTPAGDALLTDRNNARLKSYDAAAGEAARLIAADGSVRSLPISGVARSLTNGEDDPTNDWITFYTSMATVASLSGVPGYTTLSLRLHDRDRQAAERTVAAVRDELRATTPFTAFADLPLIQDPDRYPAQESIESLSGVLNVLTVLALLTALVLVSNTMTTLVGEGTGEIAAMKAIGARRRDIRRIYLRTALMLGAIGGVLGAALGILLANALTGFFASLVGTTATWGVSVPVVIASLLLGLAGPPLAALGAIRRGARVPLHEALHASGSAVGAQGRLDAALRRVRVLPRSAQIGLRGLGRRKRRSLATVVQIALAVATLLALLSVGAGVAKTTRGWFDDNHYDIWVQAAPSTPFGDGAGRLIASADGVRSTQAWLQNAVRVDGRDVQAWGLPARPLMNTRMEEGRWWSDDDVASAAKVAVVGPTLAASTGVRIGDPLRIGTSNGAVTLRVIGISGNQADNGDAVFTPVSTLQAALGAPGFVNSYWIATTSGDHGLIDRTTTRLEDALAAQGNQVATSVIYDMREQQVAANATITSTVTVLGLIIVAISMVGLINAITMSVLERTREIGMLRSVGARARDVRRIFATEGIALTIAGWLVGVPLGYVLARAIGWAAGEAVGLDIAFVFPPGYIAIALAGTVALALLIMLAPLRRAVRLRPGDALRHA